MQDIIKNFLPWILYFFIAGKTQESLNFAIEVAAITSILFELKYLKAGFVLSWGTLIFFVFMFIAVVILNNQWIAKHAWVFSNGTLALIAWISIIIRKPFTLQYAKQQVPSDQWQHPIFMKINYILSSVWGLCFLVSIFLHLIKIYYFSFPAWIYESLSDLSIFFAIWFSSWFPKWYRENARV